MPTAIVRLVPDPTTLVHVQLPTLLMEREFHATFWSGATRVREARFGRVSVDAEVARAHFRGWPQLTALRVGRNDNLRPRVDAVGVLLMVAAAEAPVHVTLADTPGTAPARPVTPPRHARRVDVLDGFGSVPEGERWLHLSSGGAL